jgi:uncharacterized protein with HEPN domain
MRRDELYVADLVDNTRAIREYLDGISREQWDQDRVRRDAVVYRLLLLGRDRQCTSGYPSGPVPGRGLAADPGFP